MHGIRHKVLDTSGVIPKPNIQPTTLTIDGLQEAGWRAWDGVSALATLPVSDAVRVVGQNIALRGTNRIIEWNGLVNIAEDRSIFSCLLVEMAVVGMTTGSVPGLGYSNSISTIYAQNALAAEPDRNLDFHTVVRYVNPGPDWHTCAYIEEDPMGIIPLTNPLDAMYNKIKITATRINDNTKRFTYGLWDRTLGAFVSKDYDWTGINPYGRPCGNVPIIWAIDEESGGISSPWGDFRMILSLQASHLDIPYGDPPQS